MLNLFAFRTVSPKVLFEARKRDVDIIGGKENWFPRITERIRKYAASPVIAAWGKHGKNRGVDARLHLDSLSYLKLNADGTPKHPLYLRADLKPKLWVIHPNQEGK